MPSRQQGIVGEIGPAECAERLNNHRLQLRLALGAWVRLNYSTERLHLRHSLKVATEG